MSIAFEGAECCKYREVKEVVVMRMRTMNGKLGMRNVAGKKFLTMKTTMCLS